MKRAGFNLQLLMAIALSATALNAGEPLVSNSAFGVSEQGGTQSVLTQPQSEPQEFDRGNLMAPEYRESSVSGFSLANPNRFSMRQSYSVNFASGSFGSQSAGLYLNTLSYKLADPLTLSADVGFYSPLYSSTGSFSKAGFQDPRMGSSLVLPRIGLEYKPSKNTTLSLQLLNGQDAYKAYGSSMDPFASSWFR
ncbi:MAG: hypothetical protein ABIW76_10970 [Fibrobacteria bacterium]